MERSDGNEPLDASGLPASIPSLPSGGAAGDLLRETDWAATPLGPMRQWPLSLLTMVRALLSTRQATCLFWGPELINLYNDGFVPLLGEKHPQAMGKRARECWSDAWPVVGDMLADVLSRGRAVLFEEMLVPIVRTGRLEDAWWNYSYSPAYDDQGSIAGVLVVATEVTAEVAARKQLEAARFQAELARQELHALFMQVPLPLALLEGSEHRFVLVNAPYRALVSRDVLNRSLSEVFSDDESAHYRPFLDRVYQSGEAVRLHEAPFRTLDVDGVLKERFIDVGYHPYLDAEGTVRGVLAIIHDVTDKVAARTRESELRHSAEAANLAKDEFLAIVSHELRNPLNAILGWARLLVGNSDPARTEKGLAVIERNAKAQAKLIEGILDMSRIVSGKVVLELRRVRLASVIQNAAESVRPAAAAKDIQLILDLDRAHLDFIADEHRLQQVVWNLLSNAVKFTGPGGHVRIRAGQLHSQVSIRVEDTGAGITADLLPHVFDRFRQGDASTTKRHGGLGLGLAIVRHLVELHGGTVKAQSDGVGRGASFEILLPIRAVEPRVPASTAAPLDDPNDRLPDTEAELLTGVRVLVVDDEDDARDLVATVLEQSGAIVSTAASAAEAIATLASTSVAAIISDIGMPLVDGYSLVQHLRSAAPDPMKNIPAIALTAYARAEDRKRAMQAGFQEHVPKPVDPEALVALVAALVAD